MVDDEKTKKGEEKAAGEESGKRQTSFDPEMSIYDELEEEGTGLDKTMMDIDLDAIDKIRKKDTTAKPKPPATPEGEEDIDLLLKKKNSIVGRMKKMFKK